MMMFNRQFCGKRKRYIRVWLLALCCCALAAAAIAAVVEIQVSMKLNPTSFMVGEAGILTVTVNGTSSAALEIPKVDLDFRQDGLYQQTTISGGKIIASVTYKFMVQADKPGKYTIGPVRIKADGKIYTTKSVKCTVLPARNSSGQTEGGQPGEQRELNSSQYTDTEAKSGRARL